MILGPDLALDGGVTNYYRTLALHSQDDIDYFAVNKKGTAGFPEKVLSVFVATLGLLRRVGHYDIVHINPSLDFNSFFRDLCLILVARFRRKQILVFFHGWEDEFQLRIQNSGLLHFLFRISYAKADRLIVLGECFRDRLVELGVNPKTPFEVETTVADSNGIDELDLASKTNSFKEGIRCLFLSRILREKGLFIAIDTIQKFTQRNPSRKISLVVAGDGPDLEEAQNYVEASGIEDVEFVGEIYNKEKQALLRSCHVMLFPTYYGEGLPSCVVEAMLFGQAVLSRNNAAIPEIVEHGANGFLTDEISSDTFVHFLEKLSELPSLYEKMANDNHQKALRLFTTEHVRARILTIYDKLEIGEHQN